MEYLVVNRTRESDIARVRATGSFLSRALGLMFRRNLKEDEGLLIEFPVWMKKPSLHSFFMFFPIDVIFINKNLKVVEKGLLKPWKLYSPANESSYVLELPEGKAIKVEVDDVLEFRKL
ncbi:MAG TPA: DUF192 domain-containing protein [Euryarchaeota archaeon]|nr:hypothetical protein BMS3Bbin15_00278 [archaeon BMS3Bbin15]HDL16198.1 DUF192 domain-containing protein [Euryarchaeota archaeon]